jgi:2-dehydro-3-deoxygluconokinase
MDNPRFEVTTIGEAMLRLSVPAGHRLELATGLDLHPAGAEANLTVALSRLGRRCAWISGLPASALGRLVANHLRMAGVDLGGVIWSETGRIGTYFIEFAMPPRPIQVIYDRVGSVASQLRADQIDWPYLLNTRLLHLTGITPAVSPSCLELTREAKERAKAAGVAVSFDINYRQKLWTESLAKEILTPLIQEVDLLLCGQGDAQRVFGCSGTPEQIVQALAEQSKAKCVVVTLGDRGVIAWDGTQFHQEDAIPVEVVDRIGAGDALAAGVIHGWLDQALPQGLRYGVILAALVLSQYGDMLVTTQEELMGLLEDRGGGVKR